MKNNSKNPFMDKKIQKKIHKLTNNVVRNDLKITLLQSKSKLLRSEINKLKTECNHAHHDGTSATIKLEGTVRYCKLCLKYFEP